MWGSDDDSDEPEPVTDDGDWVEAAANIGVAFAVALPVMEALDGLFFGADLPWQVCAVMALVMSAGGWYVMRHAERH